MKKVYALSTFAFGVPGPKAAQVIAQKAGYLLQENFYETIIPCQPFLYGYKKYNSNVFLKILRATKCSMFYGVTFNSKSIKIMEIKNCNKLIIPKVQNSLHIDIECLNWLMSMPSKEGNIRKWYQINNGDEWHLIFTEKDHIGNIRGRLIFSNLLESPFINILKKARAQLAREGILYTQFYTHLQVQPFFLIEKKAIPQVSSFNISNLAYISIAHMESRWRDFAMN